ncbi:MAG: S41 family peptidase [Alphaproteobacteria bacterium]|nr:S41 family peptidase [Alphaproteobacteria bacterium]
MTRLTVRAAVMAAAIGFIGTCLSALAVAQSQSSDTYKQLNLLGEVFERVRRDYVEEVTDEELVQSAIQGMLTSLDPHSSYLPPDNFADMQVQTRGEFGGLGIEVTMENGFVKVVSPIDETPAFRAGVKAGDFITHLDDEPVLGLTLQEAVDRMRGKVNTDIKLTIRREDESEPIDITITRDVIRIQSVRARLLEDDIAYLRVTTFNEQTDSGIESALKRYRKESNDGLVGVVLDLRNNPGGLLDEAVAVADQFLEQGEIVSTRGRHTDDAQRFNSRAGDVTGGLPVVVLINSGSASASEIVAGALQDHRRAILMGTRSFGKGSVQTIIPLPGNSAMRLTTARYYTPSGRSIQAKGIEPDIEIKQAKVEVREESRRRREADLRDALDSDEENENKNENEPSKDEKEDEAEAQDNTLEEDYQLARAVDLLRGIHLYGGRFVN